MVSRYFLGLSALIICASGHDAVPFGSPQSLGTSVRTKPVPDCDEHCKPGACMRQSTAHYVLEEDLMGGDCSGDCKDIMHENLDWDHEHMPIIYSHCDWSSCNSGFFEGENCQGVCHADSRLENAHQIWLTDISYGHKDYTQSLLHGWHRCDWCFATMTYFTCSECLPGFELVGNKCEMVDPPSEELLDQMCAASEGLLGGMEDSTDSLNCLLEHPEIPLDLENPFCPDPEFRRQLTQVSACGSTCTSLLLTMAAMNRRVTDVLQGLDIEGDDPNVPDADAEAPEILSLRFFMYDDGTADGQLEVEVTLNDRATNVGQADDHVMILHIHTNVNYMEYRDHMRNVLCPPATVAAGTRQNAITYLANRLTPDVVAQVNWRTLGAANDTPNAAEMNNDDYVVDLGGTTLNHWRRLAVDATMQMPAAANNAIYTRGRITMPSAWRRGRAVTGAQQALRMGAATGNILDSVTEALMRAIEDGNVGTAGEFDPANAEYLYATPSFYINMVSFQFIDDTGAARSAQGMNPERTTRRRLRALTTEDLPADWEPSHDLSSADLCVYLQEELLGLYERLEYTCTAEMPAETGGAPVVAEFKASKAAPSTKVAGDVIVIISPEDADDDSAISAEAIACTHPSSDDSGDMQEHDVDLSVCFTLSKMVSLGCSQYAGVSVDYEGDYAKSGSCQRDCSHCDDDDTGEIGPDGLVDLESLFDAQVCGVDGITYSSECHAKCHGTVMANVGGCHVEVVPQEHLPCYALESGHAVKRNSLSIDGSTRLYFQNSIEECAEKCDAHPECVGFVDNGNYCVFKKSLSTIYSKSSKNVYKKDAHCVAHQCYNSESGIAVVSGKAIGSEFEYNALDECSAACSADADCAGFSRVSDTHCKLYAYVTTEEAERTDEQEIDETYTDPEFWTRDFGATSTTCAAQCPDGDWEICNRNLALAPMDDACSTSTLTSLGGNNGGSYGFYAWFDITPCAAFHVGDAIVDGEGNAHVVAAYQFEGVEGGIVYEWSELEFGAELDTSVVRIRFEDDVHGKFTNGNSYEIQ